VSRQDRGDQQLERIAMDQRTVRIGVRLPEQLDNTGDLAFGNARHRENLSEAAKTAKGSGLT